MAGSVQCALCRHGNSDPAALHHGIGQQPIRFFPAFLWAEIVGVFEVDGIYTGERDELFKINVLVGFDLEAVELLFSDLAR